MSQGNLSDLYANYPGNPTGVATSIFDCKSGTIVIDTVNQRVYQKQTGLGDNSSFLEIGSLISSADRTTPAFINLNQNNTDGAMSLFGATYSTYDSRWMATVLGQNVVLGNAGFVGFDGPSNSRQAIQQEREWDSGEVSSLTHHALRGTMTVANGGTAVTGTGTAFSAQLRVGDSIKIGTAAVRTVRSIESATALTLNFGSSSAQTGQAAVRGKLALTGTCSVAAGGTAVTGVSTKFTEQLQTTEMTDIYIRLTSDTANPMTIKVASIESDTALTLAYPVPEAATGTTAYTAGIRYDEVWFMAGDYRGLQQTTLASDPFDSFLTQSVPSVISILSTNKSDVFVANRTGLQMIDCAIQCRADTPFSGTAAQVWQATGGQTSYALYDTTGDWYIRSGNVSGTVSIQDSATASGQTKIGSATSKIGFHGATAVAKQTGVPVSAAGVHAALVNLGLISA